MSSKTIPFPYEIKITHSEFCYYGTIYYFNKDRRSGNLFLFLFFTALGRMM